MSLVKEADCLCVCKVCVVLVLVGALYSLRRSSVPLVLLIRAIRKPLRSHKIPVRRISLDDAIQMALQHNHSLLAARTTIQQNQAEETTANLRPNPVLIGRLAVSADLSAEPVQRRLPRQLGAVRSRRELSV